MEFSCKRSSGGRACSLHEEDPGLNPLQLNLTRSQLEGAGRDSSLRP